MPFNLVLECIRFRGRKSPLHVTHPAFLPLEIYAWPGTTHAALFHVMYGFITQRSYFSQRQWNSALVMILYNQKWLYERPIYNPIGLLFLHLSCVNILVGVRCHLRNTEVARMIQMLQDWSSQRNVAAVTSVSDRAWFLDYGGYVRRPGQGRARCTTSGKWFFGATTNLCERCRITFHRRLACISVTKLFVTDSTRKTSEVVRVPVLSGQHRTSRFQFAQNH